MRYRIAIRPRALRALSRIPEPDQSRIMRRIDALAEASRPPGVKKLQGTDYHRIRVGDYRVVYMIEDDVLRVLVVAIGQRKKIYKKIKK